MHAMEYPCGFSYIYFPRSLFFLTINGSVHVEGLKNSGGSQAGRAALERD